MRASWDETWMKVAFALSLRAKCTNRQVGAVIVDANNRPISVGYNGEPAGYRHTGWQSCSAFCKRSVKNEGDRDGSYRNCVSVHAEANALIFADRALYSGGTIYVTNPCCWDCAKLVANSGISRVVFAAGKVDDHADWSHTVEFLKTCSIQVDILEEEKE